MDDAIKIVQAKELRGAVVRLLYDAYGEGAALSTVRKLLRYKSFYADKDIKRAVHYLSGTDKNYVEVKNDEDEYWNAWAGLTPKGVNLAEGDIEDIGVMLDE